MGLFGPNRKKSLWDALSGMSDPNGPIDPGMTSDPGYDPSSDPSYTETDPSAGDVGGPPRHKGFNWGRAAMAFFGGPEVAKQLHARGEAQKQKDALAGMGYGDDAIAALQSSPSALAQVLADRYQQPKQLGPSEFARKYADMVRIVGQKGADEWADAEAHPTQWITADNGDGTKTFVPVSRGGMGGMGSPTAPQPSPQPGGTPTAASLMPGLIQRESGGHAGILGPQTKYGQPQGSTQMLPRTAQEMAGKLGLPWQPELMTGTGPEASAYQAKLGQAYLQQGFDTNGGDPRAALMYYHGGPNKGLWGPKTRAYADAILGGQGGAQPAPQAGSPPHISSPMELAQLPSGSMYIAPDGSVKRKR